MSAGERLQRVLRAVPAIVGRDAVPVAELEQHAGVDARTLLDDLRAITDRDDEPGGFIEAVSILFGADSVAIESPHFRRPTRLTLPELCALELGLAMLAGSAGEGERVVVAAARERIREAIVALPEWAAADDLWYATTPRVSSEATLAVVRDCVGARAKVEIVYRRGDASESTQRVVHPYAALPVRGAWFLIAHCERADGLRFFRLDRVQSARRLDETFDDAIPSEAKELLISGARVMSNVAERLVIRYSARIARWIAEREDGEPSDDGCFTVSHPLGDDAWAVRHVLQYGPEAEVLEPARIRSRVAEVLRAMLAGEDENGNF